MVSAAVMDVTPGTRDAMVARGRAAGKFAERAAAVETEGEGAVLG